MPTQVMTLPQDEVATLEKPTARKKNVVPDAPDLRDRKYSPPLILPAQSVKPDLKIPILNQGATNACTGFALASFIYHLELRAKRPENQCAVSPYMLYSMARRYDEFPGDPDADTGSSLRGAMKGWFKHGACAADLWRDSKEPINDWDRDAVRRPLGAYYRIDTQSIADMQVALTEIGAIYASAACHSGWDQSPDNGSSFDGLWVIPYQKATLADGGHAFVIVGYNEHGFIIQNSWDGNWGSKGRAVLTYRDWLDNAMDCWVAQLGVPNDLEYQIAKSKTLRVKERRVHLPAEANLRNREIDPFIVDMENNGRLSTTGDFRTRREDLTALLTDHLGEFLQTWNLAADAPIDIAIYAHGGLTSEDSAADTAAEWIPALYQEKIFPIFLMWETDLRSTLENRVKDLLEREPRETGGFLDRTKKWWNERLEKLLAVPGSMIWGEMKQNAQAISEEEESGGVLLYKAYKASPFLQDPNRIRLHLIGHSAGAIVHSYIVDRLQWKFESVSFMAPAVTCKVFTQTVLKALEDRRVTNYNHFQLSDDMEQKDNTCEPILGYGRSLLYLVSRSFEKGVATPILGMERYFRETVPDKGNVHLFTAPGTDSKSTTHGDFDNDPATRKTIIDAIKQSGANRSKSN